MGRSKLRRRRFGGAGCLLCRRADCVGGAEGLEDRGIKACTKVGAPEIGDEVLYLEVRVGGTCSRWR